MTYDQTQPRARKQLLRLGSNIPFLEILRLYRTMVRQELINENGLSGTDTVRPDRSGEASWRLSAADCAEHQYLECGNELAPAGFMICSRDPYVQELGRALENRDWSMLVPVGERQPLVHQEGKMTRKD
jgi:hypothetical protein